MALVNEGMENDLLKATERGIEAKLTPETKAMYDRIVLAGMKHAIHGGANGVMRNLKSAPDPLKACAIGAVNVAFMLLKSQNPYPSPQMIVSTIYASYTLMLQAMDVAAKMKLIEITEGDGGTIDRAMRDASTRIMQATHITPEKFQKAAAAAHGVMKDPAQMQKIKLRIGADRDPRAPEPTPLPEPQEATSETA